MPLLTLYDTPIGPLTVAADDFAVTSVCFGAASDPADAAATPLLLAAKAELLAYFKGTLRTFSVPTRPHGSAFSLQVWSALGEIPYGECVSYGEIAAKIGRPKAARAVGMANHRNPIPIIIPCHRVVGATGRLVGYAGGLPIKETLLRLECENS